MLCKIGFKYGLVMCLVAAAAIANAPNPRAAFSRLNAELVLNKTLHSVRHNFFCIKFPL
jgi:hypothetical protein